MSTTCKNRSEIQLLDSANINGYVVVKLRVDDHHHCIEVIGCSLDEAITRAVIVRDAFNNIPLK